MKMALLSNLGSKINMENDEKDSINYMEYSGTFLSGACTEDKGDYDYTPLNDLVVQEDRERDYTVEQFSSLKSR